MPKLKKVLTNQVIKELETLAKNSAEKYQTFWQEFGGHLKHGIASSPTDADSLKSLLRFKTNLNTEIWSSLDDYIARMKAGGKVIYYIIGDDPKSVLRSPHLDYFSAQGTEVLPLTDPMDSFMQMGLHKLCEIRPVCKERWLQLWNGSLSKCKNIVTPCWPGSAGFVK